LRIAANKIPYLSPDIQTEGLTEGKNVSEKITGFIEIHFAVTLRFKHGRGIATVRM
jgi:hypothetical protein